VENPTEAAARHRRLLEAFRWEVPETFNFGRDVVDRFAAEPDRPALWWRSEAGAQRQLGFGEVAR
jgi:acetyl-CoA synthetase